MISITKIFSFAAAHFLPFHKGLCKEMHGHNYKLEVTIAGPPTMAGPERDMVMDFSRLDQIVQEEILIEYDHALLNNKFDNPTAERMVERFATAIMGRLKHPLRLTKLRLWETEKCYATWEPN